MGGGGEWPKAATEQKWARSEKKEEGTLREGKVWTRGQQCPPSLGHSHLKPKESLIQPLTLLAKFNTQPPAHFNLRSQVCSLAQAAKTPPNRGGTPSLLQGDAKAMVPGQPPAAPQPC